MNHTQSKKWTTRLRGFTLIELLVVISIISMLASVVLASTQAAQAKGRDAKRSQQVHQIDLAVQLYKANNNNKVPPLTGCQAIQGSDPTAAQASACFAVSTATTDPQAANWNDFKAQIAPYMPNVPNDPCPTCTTDSSYGLGYTYVAPLAMQYLCNPGGTCSQSPDVINETYQIYAPLEKSVTPSGYSSTGTFVYPALVTPPPGVLPSVSLLADYQSKNTYRIDWSVSNANSCAISEYYFSMVDQDGDNLAPDLVTITPVTSISPVFPVTVTQSGSTIVYHDYSSMSFDSPENDSPIVYLSMYCTNTSGTNGGVTSVIVRP
jgi:prepilin-type N-terminal cleavage/methylation domain-containing protein